MTRIVLLWLFVLIASTAQAQVSYPPLMLRDEGTPLGRMTAGIDFTGQAVTCTWASGVGTCNIPYFASTNLTDSSNIPLLNALQNTFVSAVTTQSSALSVAGTGVTSGRVVTFTGSNATPGASASGSLLGSVLHVSGNQGSSDTNSVNRNSLAMFNATINTATLNAYNSAVHVLSSMSNTTNASFGLGLNARITDNTTLANTLWAIDTNAAISGIAAKTITGIRGRASSSAALTTGTQTIYGVQGTASSTSLAGAVANVYGGHFQGGGSVASGSLNSYGAYVVNALSMNTTGTTRNVGLFVETPTGADTNYAALFQGGLVGIGTETPLSTLSINGGLHVGGDSDAGDNNLIVDGTVTATGGVIGNASTATALQTPRAINGVNFDGTAPITVTAAAGTLTGATLAAGVTASSLTSVGTLADLTVTNPITGSITGSSGSTTGNAATATALQNARTIAGVSFNGTANIAIPSTGLSDSSNLARLDAANVFSNAAGVTTSGGPLSGNTGGVAVTGFVVGLRAGGWDALGYASAATTLALGGFRSSQWSGVDFYTNGALNTTLSAAGQLYLQTASSQLKIRTGASVNDTVTLGGTANQAMTFVTNAGGEKIKFIGDRTGSGGGGDIRLSSDSFYGFTNSTNGGTLDTAITKVAAASIAIGNGTAGDGTATVRAANLGLGTAPSRPLHVLSGTLNQFIAAQTTVPTCSASCGTSPSVTGSDTFMTVTMGATGTPASGFVITFSGAWPAAPSCVGAMAKAGMVVGKLPLTLVTTTTTITVVTNGTAPAVTDKYHFHCGGF
jgi:hypothetical protein